MEAEAGSARKDLDDARRAKERMASRVAALYADGEDAKAEALEDALAQVREREGGAERRLNAALDAAESAALLVQSEGDPRTPW